MSFEHHRNANLVYIDSALVKELTVTTTPVEVKAGTTTLYGRKRVYVLNDSSNIIYLSSKSNFVVGTDTVIAVYSGQIYSFDVDPNPENRVPYKFYVCIADGYTSTTIKIWEVT